MIRHLVLSLCALSAGCDLLLPFQPGATPGREAGLDRPISDRSHSDGRSDGRPFAPVGCAYGRKISVPAGTVTGGQDLVGFPLLVALSGDQALRSKTNGGHVEHELGFDIRFLGSDGKTVLEHEVEVYDGSAGTLRAWVRSRLLASSDTVLYLCYGDPGITSPTEQPGGTWGADHVGVWHLRETGGQRNDSTSRAHHLAECHGGVGASAQGVVGGAAVFKETLQSYLCVADAKQPGLDPPGAVTISLWMKTDRGLGGWRNLVSKWAHAADGPDPGDSYYLGLLQSGTVQNVKFAMESDAGEGQVVGQVMIPADTWHHLAAVYDGSGLAVFVNGVLDRTYSYSSGARDSATELAVGGKGSALDYCHDGLLDEVRIANVARPAGWIAAEHRAVESGLCKIAPEETR